MDNDDGMMIQELMEDGAEAAAYDEEHLKIIIFFLLDCKWSLMLIPNIEVRTLEGESLSQGRGWRVIASYTPTIFSRAPHIPQFFLADLQSELKKIIKIMFVVRGSTPKFR
jgi:hypothetical protein